MEKKIKEKKVKETLAFSDVFPKTLTQDQSVKYFQNIGKARLGFRFMMKIHCFNTTAYSAWSSV